MTDHVRFFAAAVACTMLTLPHLAVAQTAPATPPSLVTPDRVESRLGILEFKDGVPNKATADKVFDNLDFTYAYRAFMDNMRGVSIHALCKGMQSIGGTVKKVFACDLFDGRLEEYGVREQRQGLTAVVSIAVPPAARTKVPPSRTTSPVSVCPEEMV